MNHILELEHRRVMFAGSIHSLKCNQNFKLKHDTDSSVIECN